MSLLSDEAVSELMRLTERNWLEVLSIWQGCERITLLPEVQTILTRSVCEWAGVPLTADEVTVRSGQLAALIDGAGGIGARHWQARRARRESEDWISTLIAQVRNGSVQAGRDQALSVVARHRDADGQLLNEKTAAVEMITCFGLRSRSADSSFTPPWSC